MKPMFEMLAAYNAWANERLYAAAAALAEEDYRADHGAFFGSVHGMATLFDMGAALRSGVGQ